MGANRGSYSRNMYDEARSYVQNRVQQGVPWLDADDNDYQQSFCNQIRRVEQVLGDGSNNDGFKCVGTGANNDMDVLGGGGTGENAGRLWVRGLGCALFDNTTFKNVGANESGRSLHPRITNMTYNGALVQSFLTDSAADWQVNEHAGKTITPNITRPASVFTIVSNTRTEMVLTGDATPAAAIGDHYRIEMRTPPVAPRTDYVYLNVYLDEYDDVDDPNLIHQLVVPTVAQLRMKLIHTIYVRESADTLVDYVDSDGNQHWVMKITEISRTNGVDAIGVNDVIDRRPLFFGSYSDMPLRQVYGVDTGLRWGEPTPAYDIYPAPGFISPAQILPGTEVMCKAINANVGATNIYVNGFGPYNLKKNGNFTDLSSGDISAGEVFTVVYDGSVFQMHAGQPGEWLINGTSIYYNVGNVGIGTSTPGERLQVNGAIQLGASSVPAWDTSTRFWFESGFGTRYDGYAHRFDVGGSRTEAMRITNGGLVGIGTASPVFRLHVVESNAAIDAYELLETPFQNRAGVYRAAGFNAPEGPGTEIRTIGEFAVGGSAYPNWGLGNSLNIILSVGDRNNPGPITFNHYYSGTGREQARIMPSGNVGIGTVSPTSLLHVNYNGGGIGSTVLGQFMQPTMADGNVADIFIGRAVSDGNCAVFGFIPNPVLGQNAAYIGVYGAPTGLYFNRFGNLGVGYPSIQHLFAVGQDTTAGINPFNVNNSGDVHVNGGGDPDWGLYGRFNVQILGARVLTGQLYIPYSAGGAGKVLTDVLGNGYASWETPVYPINFSGNLAVTKVYFAVATASASVPGSLAGTGITAGAAVAQYADGGAFGGNTVAAVYSRVGTTWTVNSTDSNARPVSVIIFGT